MKSLLGVLGIAATVALCNGCSTIYPENSSVAVTKGPQILNDFAIDKSARIGKDNTLKTFLSYGVGSNSVIYDLREKIIEGERYFVLPNTGAEANELGFMFAKRSDVSFVIDYAGGTTTVEPTKVYIPTKAKEDKKTILEVVIKAEGDGGIKAKMPEVDAKGIRAGTLPTTNSDYPFRIQTTTFEEDLIEYFTPSREVKAGTDELPFFLIPEAGTRIRLSADGKIGIICDGNVFTAQPMTRSAYETRVQARKDAIAKEMADREAKLAKEKEEAERKAKEEKKKADAADEAARKAEDARRKGTPGVVDTLIFGGTQ